MFLIEEYQDSFKCELILEKETENIMGFQGVFMQGDIVNRNNRTYPFTEVLKPATEKYLQERVKTGRAWGELNHPNTPDINLENVCHRVTEMTFDESNVRGKSILGECPKAGILRGLLKTGNVGVSSRGLGELAEKEDKNHNKQVTDFYISAIDVVADWSAPDALVHGINESKEYVITKGGDIILKQYEIFDKSLRNGGDKVENVVAAIRKFLDSI